MLNTQHHHRGGIYVFIQPSELVQSVSFYTVMGLQQERQIPHPMV